MALTCPACGQVNRDDALICSLCQRVFRKEPRKAPAPAPPAPRVAAAGVAALLSRAAILTNQGKAEEGLALVDTVVEAFPAHHDAQLQRGTTLEALGRHDEAAAAFRKASELAPGDVVALRRLGQALARAGRHAEAVTAFDAALGLDLRSAPTWAERALSVLSQGDVAGALECCERSLAVDPRLAVAKLTKAECEEQLGRPADALKTYQQFLNLASPYQAELVRRARERVAALKGGA